MTMAWRENIEKINNTQYFQGWETTATLIHCLRECRMMQPLWLSVWQVLIKLKYRYHVPYFPGAAMTKSHKLGGLTNRNLISRSSGGWSQNQDVLCKGECVPGLSLASEVWWRSVVLHLQVLHPDLPSSSQGSLLASLYKDSPTGLSPALKTSS